MTYEDFLKQVNNFIKGKTHMQVHWVDSRGPSSNWKFLKDCNRQNICDCRSLGYFIFADHKQLVIAQSVADTNEPQITGCMQIPASAIAWIRVYEHD